MKYKKIFFGSIIIFLIGVIVFFKERKLLNGYFSSVKLRVLLKCMNEQYLYDVDETAGAEGIYNGYLSALDNEDTRYLNKVSLKSAKIQAKGNEFGVGLRMAWSQDEHYLVVIEVLEHSPAQKAGIKIGDCITKIDDVQIISTNYSELVNLIYNETDEEVHYEIRRDGEVFEIELKPEEIILEDFREEMIQDILYVELKHIKEGTSDRLKEVLQKQGTKSNGMILDLRDLETDNVEEIRKISDLFLDEGIAFKVQTKAQGVESYKTEEGSYDINMIVLTNTGTKSGGEALVLALQERAQIIGSNTGGDAYIKKIISFEDGTGMSVASGSICDRYGKQLSKEGIEPDIRLYIDKDEKLQMLESAYRDSYLQEAIKRLK